MTAERVEMIRQRLSEALEPVTLEIEDDSAAHAGHAGARHGGHFNVTIVSQKFDGLNPIKRHQLVYAAVNDLMNTEIHALSIKAMTPDEA